MTLSFRYGGVRLTSEFLTDSFLLLLLTSYTTLLKFGRRCLIFNIRNSLTQTAEAFVPTLLQQLKDAFFLTKLLCKLQSLTLECLSIAGKLLNQNSLDILVSLSK